MATTDSTFKLTTENDSFYDYDNYEDEMCKKNSVILFGAIFTLVLFPIVVILSVFGNVLVIVVLTKYENLKSLTNALILNLAVSDLFFTAGLPFWTYNHVHGWTLGEHTCKMVNFIFYVGFYSSSILLMLMTAHRYVAVMNPLSDIVSSTGSCSVVACVTVWAVSALAASPSFFFTKVDQEQSFEGVTQKSYNGLQPHGELMKLFSTSQIQKQCLNGLALLSNVLPLWPGGVFTSEAGYEYMASLSNASFKPCIRLRSRVFASWRRTLDLSDSGFPDLFFLGPLFLGSMSSSWSPSLSSSSSSSSLSEMSSSASRMSELELSAACRLCSSFSRLSAETTCSLSHGTSIPYRSSGSSGNGHREARVYRQKHKPERDNN
ncbi:C-C chemokine receptor type 3 [Liparis tanakae]|uniref:C-C chemokine receptor type 3 n=1 Tax=Liparis tanakae TaxID=230148 RepID=A0A4Z2GD55_9TELE|nr:C-C chemokine receptor type 3 [Liparis tanakae]